MLLEEPEQGIDADPAELQIRTRFVLSSGAGGDQTQGPIVARSKSVWSRATRLIPGRPTPGPIPTARERRPPGHRLSIRRRHTSVLGRRRRDGLSPRLPPPAGPDGNHERVAR